MLENTIKRFRSYVDKTYVVTLKSYERWMNGLKVQPIYEPQRNESAFSVLYGLREIYKKEGDCYIVQSPSDHYLDHKAASFKEVINQGIEEVEKNHTIVAIGVSPRNASTNYGYMLQKEEDFMADFFEKPHESLAEVLCDEGFLWNTAIYIYRLSDMLREYSYLEADMVRREDEDFYLDDPKQFEKSIIQKTPKLKVIRGFFYWDDIGTIDKVEQWGCWKNDRKEIEINTRID